MRYIRSWAIVNDARRKWVGRGGPVPDGFSDRITVRPPFDPQEFAWESERATVSPPPEALARTESDAPELVSGSMEVVWPVEATAVPQLAVAREDLEWFELPQAARKLLEQLDGQATVGTIAERAGVPILEATDLFEELIREGIVAPLPQF
jgi:hypothetical protein